MNEFAQLYRALDETTKTSRKITAMREYFSTCTASDGAWAIYFLSGRRFKRLISTGRLREWCASASQVPDWMFDECYGAVGDLAETMALLMPEESTGSTTSLTDWIENRIRPLSQMSDADCREAMITAWGDLSAYERFVFNKLVTGGFRVGVAQQMVIRALAETSGVDAAVIAHRLMGTWEPVPDFFTWLLAPDSGESDSSKPYPFCLAHPTDGDEATLGNIDDWIVEWKWDGIRGQVIRRGGQSFVWSRGEEPMLERFPELVQPVAALPDGTVLDGEILGWNEGGVLPFSEMQRRIGRKTIGKKLLAEVPVRFVAFDLLEENGQDLRKLPLSERRQRLDAMIAAQPSNSSIMASPLIESDSWEDLRRIRESSRETKVEGLMLKRASSEYGVGRVTGLWWKWKIEPYTCDAVLVYAQRGNGRRASLYTDYTFAAWDGGSLVPFAKAYSGLTDAEIREVDRYIREHTLERFGPVRAVTAELVFELAFEDIQVSKRHKSGIAVRFPRIARWRRDKKPEQADSLETIRGMMRQATSPGG
ncbi:ATP-dependent DNA ligase [Schlesneria sp. DSM 10557]|uniref:ATP-dependent DNA ligase n=1 Tax=Schlesneria sp. DSM 10557 TaxID=3044399 RepID=UPI00359FB2C3